MEYTKGEWKRGSLDDEPFARSCLSIFKEDGRRIAEISREGFMRIEEAEANAYLISAAPNLYEALLSALGSLVALGIKDHSWGQGILDNIQKALSKAKSK